MSAWLRTTLAPGRNRCCCDGSQRSSPLSPPHRTELKKDHLRFKITTSAPGTQALPYVTPYPFHQQGPGRPGGPAGPRGPFPGQANPTWMGRIEPEYYRPAPGTLLLPCPPWVPRSPAVTAPGMRSGGLLALTVGGAALAFVSLLLVVPFLVASTGVGGFIVGFVVSLIPLSVVLLTVHAIDRWEPEPKRLLFFAFPGARQCRWP